MSALPHPPDQISITRRERQKRQAEDRRSRRKGYGFVPWDIILIILLAAVAVVLYALIQSKVTGKAPELAGRQFYIARDGSMRPTFGPGSLLAARAVEPPDLEVDDIIVFVDPENALQVLGHRIEKIDIAEGLVFTTRGDANLRDDPMPVPEEYILGKYEFSISYAGYILEFGRTAAGLIIMVLVPAFLVIVFELYKLRRHLAALRKKRR